MLCLAVIRFLQANNNGEAFVVEPKLETENEVDGSAASENEEWSDADLTGPTTPHQTQAGVTAAAVAAAAVAAAAVAAQSFASTAPFSNFTYYLEWKYQVHGLNFSIAHVPWGESLAAAAAAAIASSSSIAGPSGALGAYNIQAPTAAPPVIAPVRGKQRNTQSNRLFKYHVVLRDS